MSNAVLVELIDEAIAETGIDRILARRSLVTLASQGRFNMVREPPGDITDEEHIGRISFRMNQCAKHAFRKILMLLADIAAPVGCILDIHDEAGMMMEIARFWRAVAKRIWRDKIARWLCEQTPDEYDYKFGLCVFEVRECEKFLLSAANILEQSKS